MTPKKTIETPQEVDITPVVKLAKDENITIFIDPEMVGMTGIRINGKMYLGETTVSKDQAKDLLRIQSEYYETVKKLKDPSISVRMKNDFQKETLFLADPKENERKPGFTRDYGLLGAKEWSYCSDIFKEHLLKMRKQMFGY